MVPKFFARFIILLTLTASVAHATTIDYSVTALGGTRWRYDYTLHNDSLGGVLQEFTLYFDGSLYANLSDESTVAGWDLLLIQPDTGIPAAGFFDGLSRGSALMGNAALGGLSVSFDYLGQGAPNFQPFSILDATTFVELDSGLTTSTAIPLPGTLGLFALGLLAGAVQRRRQGGRQ